MTENLYENYSVSSSVEYQHFSNDLLSLEKWYDFQKAIAVSPGFGPGKNIFQRKACFEIIESMMSKTQMISSTAVVIL